VPKQGEVRRVLFPPQAINITKKTYHKAVDTFGCLKAAFSPPPKLQLAALRAPHAHRRRRNVLRHH
jgi:hypothetical protein